jgi:hypothetical protein
MARKRTPEQAATLLRGLHKAIMGDVSTVLSPVSTLAFQAAKTTAGRRPTPQAPNLARAWSLEPRGDSMVLSAAENITFRGGPVWAGDVEGGILFGSNRSPQFRRPHGVPSWAWDVMERALESAQADRLLQAAIDKAVR